MTTEKEAESMTTGCIGRSFPLTRKGRIFFLLKFTSF